MKKAYVLFIVLALLPSVAYCDRPKQCNEMEPMFTTGEWAKGINDDMYSCLGSRFYADGSKFFYTVTSKKDSEKVERCNFAVLFSSNDKHKKTADILRLMDKVSVLVKKITGKEVPEYLLKAALEMREGEYYVEGKHISISTKGIVTDMVISIWE